MTCHKLTNDEGLPAGFICVADEVDIAGAWDLRTQIGREAEVLCQVITDGGFSVWWAMDNAKRAHAIDRLAAHGVIVRAEEQRPFPWCAYLVRREGLDMWEAHNGPLGAEP